MNTRNKKPNRYEKNNKAYFRKLTVSELRVIAYIATLLLAAVAIIYAVESPVVWAFLGMAIGSVYEKGNSN